MTNAVQPRDRKSTTVINSTIVVTMFDDLAARRKHEVLWTLQDLAQLIQDTIAPSKASLPLLKLARFGDRPTPKHGCLRHNANVKAITGIEGDDDSGIMGFDETVDTLTKAGVAAIVYTSPSHTLDAPRSRVLCPTSMEYPPDQRDLFMGRLNGLFSGSFADESWALSQCYYYGSVNGNPAHRVELICGTPIDLHPDLPWLGGSGTGGRTPGSAVDAGSTTAVRPSLTLGSPPPHILQAKSLDLNAAGCRSVYSIEEVTAAVESIPDGYENHPLGSGDAWRTEFVFPLADYSSRHPEHKASVRALFCHHTRRIADPSLVAKFPAGAKAYFAAAEKRFDREVRDRANPMPRDQA
jgi:hypothetical protein